MQLHRAYDGLDWVYGTTFTYEEETDTWRFYDAESEEWSMVGKPEPQIGEIDKNGKQLYLNDIVKHRLGTGVIQYTNGEYYVDWRKGMFYQSRLSMLKNTFEIIGNLTEERL